MLVLFDIDGTLLRSQRIGVRAMTAAGQSLYGESFSLEGIPVAGRLDPLIWKDAARAHDVDITDANHVIFRETYTGTLKQMLVSETAAYLLPGVAELIAELARRDSITIALLTGNYPATGRMKIDSAGLDPDLFALGAFGDDGASRRELPPVAMARYQERFERAIDPVRTIIIGDTEHDVDCAKVNGCRSIAVATGMSSVEELTPFGADLTVSDLGDVDRIADWIAAQDCVGT
jgi:phosphoglycolate phosphatase-like HAD superfamily hydrolase